MQQFSRSMLVSGAINTIVDETRCDMDTIVDSGEPIVSNAAVLLTGDDTVFVGRKVTL